jgi:hypothetical protein
MGSKDFTPTIRYDGSWKRKIKKKELNADNHKSAYSSPLALSKKFFTPSSPLNLTVNQSSREETRDGREARKKKAKM